MRRDGGRPKIDRDPVKRPFVEAGPEMHDPRRVFIIAQMHGNCDFPCALAQSGLQRLQDLQIGLYVLKLPLVAQSIAQTLKIARGVVHVGFKNLDVKELGRRVQDDIACFGPFADDLFVDLTFGGHVDHHIAHDLRLAAQTAALDQSALVLIPLLDAVPFRQGILGHGDPVFGKLPIAGRDLTFRTNPAPAANGVQIDAQLPRRRKHRCALGKVTAFARRREYHKGIVAHLSLSSTLCRTIA